MALLAARNTGEATIDNIGNDTWAATGTFPVTTSGTVTSIKVKCSGLTSLGTGNLKARLKRSAAVLGEGQIPDSTIPDIPAPTAWYTITISGSPSITAAENLYVELNAEVTSGVLVINWARQSQPLTHLVELHGTATPPPGKATTPTPTDNQDGLLITGKDNLKQLAWVAPTDETPDYKVYFRSQGGSWVLQETITDDSTSHTLSSDILNTFSYYSIYEWRVDTVGDGGTTTGDTWTFITQQNSQFTNYTRRSDYDEDKIWEPGTGWVAPNTFEYTGGGRYKGRVVVIGHKIIYFGDI